jgi:hypothetical protein
VEGSRVSQLPRRRGRRRPRVCAGLRIPPPSPGREGAEPGVTGPAVPSPAPLPLPSPRRSQPPARPRELGAASAAGAGPGCAHARRVSAAAGGGERARGWGSGLRCWGARGRSLEEGAEPQCWRTRPQLGSRGCRVSVLDPGKQDTRSRLGFGGAPEP